jgi:alkanesulfonate monooxygenase SsuD/methylene tetrahydromethanopterin reductase-like flavin-dependent oxidoreductase (luciferase family)
VVMYAVHQVYSHALPSIDVVPETSPYLLAPQHTQFTDDWVDLDKWYEDPKRRHRSAAVAKSAYLKRRHQERHPGATYSTSSGAPPPRPRSRGPRPSVSGGSSGEVGY